MGVLFNLSNDWFISSTVFTEHSGKLEGLNMKHTDMVSAFMELLNYRERERLNARIIWSVLVA